MSLPFVVAELSASHLGSLDRALKLVDVAADCGASAVKIQTWDVMTVADHAIEAGTWKGRRLAELYDEAKTPWEWHRPIFDRCHERGLVGFSTPFDEASADFLAGLAVPCYKIASFEITHLALIRHAAATGKPIVISTGMATEAEIDAAVEVATVAGAGGITLLKCVSAYPAPLEDFNLITMAHMAERFGCPTGLSDHTRGSTTAVAATAFGAVMIEKHLSLDHEGPDGSFATTPDEFRDFVRQVRDCALAVGGVAYGPTPAEAESLKLRRSIWVTRDIGAGEALTRDNVAVMRPQGGMEPAAFDSLMGRRTSKFLARGNPVQENALAAYETS